jgi:prepilin signal peptidase PulO-like enzyme (type II secretory pathway)
METIFPPLPEWFWYPICFLYGSIVGSFLNVLIYRIPLSWTDKNIGIGGKSFCPRCRSELAPYHNVPLFGFLFLRGRCAFCKVRISWRYFSVELLTACLWTVLYHQVSGRSGISWVDYVGQALFASVLIAMIFIDLDHFIALDELNVTAGIIAIVRDVVCLGLAFYVGQSVWQETAQQFLYFGWLPRGLVGAVVYGGSLYLVSFLSFLYYGRGDGEPLDSTARRFFTMAPIPDEYLPKATEESASEAIANALVSEDSEAEEGKSVSEEADEEPVRLRFSPGFLALVSALLLIVPAGPWAALAFVIPLLAFLALSRKDGEFIGSQIARFFSADDQRGMPDDAEPLDFPEEPELTPDELKTYAELMTIEEMTPSELTVEQQELLAQLTSVQRSAVMQYQSDQFAEEAQDGSFGGMGMGDVKLAVAVGLLIGPALSLLSLFFATALGAITGVVLMQRHRRSGRLAVPFIPFMAAGAIIVMLFGAGFIDWYLTISGVKPRPTPPPEPPRRMRRNRPVEALTPLAKTPFSQTPSTGTVEGSR